MESEVQDYLTESGILEKQIRDATKALNEEAFNWRPLHKDTNSIYAILRHLAGAETYWVRQIINGETINRERESEFHASGHLSEFLDNFEKISVRNEEILRKLTQSQLNAARTVPTRPDWSSITVRGCILHLISHYAIHLGHIQLTRQLWEQR